MRVKSWVRGEWVVGVLVVTIAVSAARAEDKPWSRAHRLDVYPTIQWLGGDETPFYAGTYEGRVEDALLYGGGLGFNLNDHINIHGDLQVGRTDTVLSPVDFPDEHDNMGVTFWLGDINVDYNILKSHLTPLVTAGAGFAKWRNHDEGRGEIHGAYSLGAGARWDINENFALRVVYRSTWTELEYADEFFRFNGVMANLIIMLK